jgi:HAMP domain-containing protein
VEHLVPLGQVTRELEALKLRLAAMDADAVTPEDAAAMAQEIGAIRLQLKRLRLDQQAMAEAVRAISRTEEPSLEVGRVAHREPIH